MIEIAKMDGHAWPAGVEISASLCTCIAACRKAYACFMQTCTGDP